MYNRASILVLVVSIIHLSKSLELTLRDIDDDDDDINEINKDLHLLEGDIMQMKRRVPRNAALYRALWDIPVPYVLDHSLDMDAKGVVLQAFEQFRLKSCVDFKTRDSEQYYITVRKIRGCYSYVARLVRGGQVVSIGDKCNRLGTVEHEFLHALGFWHEHSRYDRDDHVTIVWDNIKDAHMANFNKLSPRRTTTLNTPYDYTSVMHYRKNSFSKHKGITIRTNIPEYQDLIGQRLEMSPTDALRLNRLYNCGASISFMAHCNFANGGVCGMSRCAKGLAGWKTMTAASGGPFTDHTSLGKTGGYFMHASTTSGLEGASAWLETRRMRTKRKCRIQCLQFYYYHSGSQSDQLNIWIREFQGKKDSTGKLRLMGQITGPPKSEWQFHHVPLNATKHFQVEFEVRKGAGPSSGGFSIDDINLSETECPHHVWKIKDFEKLLNTSDYGSYLFSPVSYSPEGYAYQAIIVLKETSFGLYVHLVSGEYDARLEWPCAWRQVTVTLLDKNPHIQQQMSKQFTTTFDPAHDESDNPRKRERIQWNGKPIHMNPANGIRSFISLTHLKARDMLKGGTAIFLFTMQDISSLLHKSALPCPPFLPTKSISYPSNRDRGPCRAASDTKAAADPYSEDY